MEFTLTTTISATAKQIYKSWLSTQGHTKMTGKTAYVSDKIGDAFTSEDVNITGRNLALEPYHRIVQSWRSEKFDATDNDSQIEIILNDTSGETELTLKHTNIPESCTHYEEAWNTRYFKPMKAYFQVLNNS